MLPLSLTTLGQAPSPSSSADGSRAVLAALIGLTVSMIVLPLLAIWLARLGRKWFLSGDGEPRCGACGYSVRGLTALCCPECGADLRGVGIVRRDPAGLWWTLISWSIFIGAFWALAVGAVIGNFHLMTGQQMPRDYAWVPTSVCAAYFVAWLIGVMVILRFQRRPLAWNPQHGSGGGGSVPSGPAAASTATVASGGAAGPASRVLTIMFIDMADYTASVGGASRDGVIAIVRRVRELVKPAVALRHGRIVKTMGDGFLVTFESATDALLAGRAIQRAAAAANGGGIGLRIGVTTGEVAIEADDVYGEPVNLASRIQQLAKPGDVCFSESTWHAMTRSEVRHEEAGRFEVKGVERPVLVYRAVGE